jgi:ADP-ribose pyrophosphatase
MLKLDGTEVLSTRTIHASNHFTVLRDTFVANGERRERDWISHNPSVRVVCVTRDNRFVLIREFKYASDQYVLCLPAGEREQNELHVNAGIRELREEAGYASDDWQDLGPYLMAASLVRQDAHVLLAQNAAPCESGCSNNDYENSRIQSALFTYPELCRAIRSGDLVDGQALAALLKAFVHMNFLATG